MSIKSWAKATSMLQRKWNRQSLLCERRWSTYSLSLKSCCVFKKTEDSKKTASQIQYHILIGESASGWQDLPDGLKWCALVNKRSGIPRLPLKWVIRQRLPGQLRGVALYFPKIHLMLHFNSFVYLAHNICQWKKYFVLLKIPYYRLDVNTLIHNFETTKVYRKTGASVTVISRHTVGRGTRHPRRDSGFLFMGSQGYGVKR